MTTKINATATNIFKTTNSPSTTRSRNTIAAAIGAAAGLGLTAISERSNAVTLGATAVFGVLSVGAVHQNDLLHALAPDNTEAKVVIGAAIGVETALFGCIMNLVAGDVPSAE